MKKNFQAPRNYRDWTPGDWALVITLGVVILAIIILFGIQTWSHNHPTPTSPTYEIPFNEVTIQRIGSNTLKISFKNPIPSELSVTINEQPTSQQDNQTFIFKKYKEGTIVFRWGSNNFNFHKTIPELNYGYKTINENLVLVKEQETFTIATATNFIAITNEEGTWTSGYEFEILKISSPDFPQIRVNGCVNEGYNTVGGILFITAGNFTCPVIEIFNSPNNFKKNEFLILVPTRVIPINLIEIYPGLGPVAGNFYKVTAIDGKIQFSATFYGEELKYSINVEEIPSITTQKGETIMEIFPLN